MIKFERVLTELLDENMQTYHLSGYDCSVYWKGQEVYRRMQGVADIKKNTPISNKTLYNIYSNTKVITAVAALQLYEQGKFLLEDEISLYFPVLKNLKVKTEDGEVIDAKTPITIRDLFCMTAGIGDGDDYAETGMQFFIETGGACPIMELPTYLAKTPLFFEPRTAYKYGICYEILAALIEKISGETFGEYLKKHIFEPLDMQDTTFTLDEDKKTLLANQYRYVREDKPLETIGQDNCLIPPILKESASGGLISSVDDYMKFQLALASSEKLLRRSTIELMRLNQLSEKEMNGYGYAHLGMGYGLGVRTIIDQAKCGSPIGFGPFGWGGASGSYGSIDPENELCIFYMQHVFDTNDVRLHNRIRNIIYSNMFLL